MADIDDDGNNFNRNAPEDMIPSDPVHLDPDNGYWYFYDETWADRYGPYTDEKIARDMLEHYSKHLQTGEMSKDFQIRNVVILK